MVQVSPTKVTRWRKKLHMYIVFHPHLNHESPSCWFYSYIHMPCTRTLAKWSNITMPRIPSLACFLFVYVPSSLTCACRQFYVARPFWPVPKKNCSLCKSKSSWWSIRLFRIIILFSKMTSIKTHSTFKKSPTALEKNKLHNTTPT